jgi:hypothetical protein
VCRSIVRSHKAALYATRYFWKQLLNHNISFSALTRAFANIERNQKYAEKAYRLILERYPTSPKLLRTYGRFLEVIQLLYSNSVLAVGAENVCWFAGLQERPLGCGKVLQVRLGCGQLHWHGLPACCTVVVRSDSVQLLHCVAMTASCCIPRVPADLQYQITIID